mgnify:CR=1 FL=1
MFLLQLLSADLQTDSHRTHLADTFVNVAVAIDTVLRHYGDKEATMVSNELLTFIKNLVDTTLAGSAINADISH